MIGGAMWQLSQAGQDSPLLAWAVIVIFALTLLYILVGWWRDRRR